MALQHTSFQKKNKSRIPYIPGTKPSIQNAQLLGSSGIPSLDYVIGGGVPVGTILLIEEDKYGSYAKLVAKYFLSEGIVCGHSVLAASQDVDCQTLVHELPAPIKPEDSTSTNEGDKMTIAWRYQNLRTVESSPTNTAFGHNFDLTKYIEDDVLKKSDVSLWSGCVDKLENKGGFSNPSFLDLLCKIHCKLKEGQFGISANPEKRNLMRIAVLSLGSPLWAPTESDLARFCYCLRALVRSAYAICLITVPSHLYQNESIVKRCEHLCDISVRLESFAGSEKETNPVYKDYHGLFHINKLSAINTLAPHIPESIDLAFKLKRRKFLIEKLHLPPELQESVQREQDDLASGVL
ncbi:hypothetical protein L9F63_021481 [Diploptera punctata]|uniref:Elongator complex protein 4 n=1 Tax=Diploptera punctata TaxID=6984 RepID=A0AAD7ZNU3_DIPPU|nr:hypothetical protein L9F63_021481 [Diploptera punctata]